MKPTTYADILPQYGTPAAELLLQYGINNLEASLHEQAVNASVLHVNAHWWFHLLCYL